jgi:hypothetical protein
MLFFLGIRQSYRGSRPAAWSSSSYRLRSAPGPRLVKLEIVQPGSDTLFDWRCLVYHICILTGASDECDVILDRIVDQRSFCFSSGSVETVT